MADIHLDYEAIGEILRTACGPAVNEVALQVAARVADDRNLPAGATVNVRQFVTDRAIAVVAIAHPQGMAAQAKHGVLTKAAASVGLEVKAKK